MLKTKGAGNITSVDESITKLPSRHLGMAMVLVRTWSA